jgi:hypothetical protein
LNITAARDSAPAEPARRVAARVAPVSDPGSTTPWTGARSMAAGPKSYAMIRNRLNRTAAAQRTVTRTRIPPPSRSRAKSRRQYAPDLIRTRTIQPLNSENPYRRLGKSSAGSGPGAAQRSGGRNLKAKAGPSRSAGPETHHHVAARHAPEGGGESPDSNSPQRA